MQFLSFKRRVITNSQAITGKIFISTRKRNARERCRVQNFRHFCRDGHFAISGYGRATESVETSYGDPDGCSRRIVATGPCCLIDAGCAEGFS